MSNLESKTGIPLSNNEYITGKEFGEITDEVFHLLLARNDRFCSSLFDDAVFVNTDWQGLPSLGTWNSWEISGQEFDSLGTSIQSAIEIGNLDSKDRVNLEVDNIIANMLGSMYFGQGSLDHTYSVQGKPSCLLVEGSSNGDLESNLKVESDVEDEFFDALDSLDVSPSGASKYSSQTPSEISEISLGRASIMEDEDEVSSHRKVDKEMNQQVPEPSWTHLLSHLDEDKGNPTQECQGLDSGLLYGNQINLDVFFGETFEEDEHHLHRKYFWEITADGPLSDCCVENMTYGHVLDSFYLTEDKMNKMKVQSLRNKSSPDIACHFQSDTSGQLGLDSTVRHSCSVPESQDSSVDLGADVPVQSLYVENVEIEPAKPVGKLVSGVAPQVKLYPDGGNTENLSRGKDNCVPNLDSPSGEE